MIPEAVFSETPDRNPGTDQIRWPPMGLTSLGWGGYLIEAAGQPRVTSVRGSSPGSRPWVTAVTVA